MRGWWALSQSLIGYVKTGLYDYTLMFIGSTSLTLGGFYQIFTGNTAIKALQSLIPSLTKTTFQAITVTSLLLIVIVILVFESRISKLEAKNS